MRQPPEINHEEIKLSQEYSQLVPKISEAEFESIKRSIQDNGLLVPLIINQNGLLLDGYTRLRACKELGIKPRTMCREFEDTLAEQKFIIQVNLQRRHLVPFQVMELLYKLDEIEKKKAQNRQSIAGKIYGRGKKRGTDSLASFDAKLLLAKTEKGKRTAKVAEKAGVSQSLYERAKTIIKEGSEEQKEALRKDRTSINKEYNEIVRRKNRQEFVESAKIHGTKLPDDLNLIEGDFRYVSDVIQDNSVELIFTDPIYGKKYVGLFRDLGDLANRKLIEGGSLVTYCGTGELLEAGNILTSSGLKYIWTIVVQLTGPSAAVHPVKINIKYKPLLWFAKGSPNVFEYTYDVIVSRAPKKILHKWEESEIEAENLISKLTVPNQLVLDPLVGSAVTGLAAVKLDRQFIGIEENPLTLETARARISEALALKKGSTK